MSKEKIAEGTVDCEITGETWLRNPSIDNPKSEDDWDWIEIGYTVEEKLSSEYDGKRIAIYVEVLDD